MACAINLPVMAAHLVDHVIGWWNSAASGESAWATLGPRRLAPNWQTGTLWGTSGRMFLGAAPVYSSTTVEFEKLDGSAPAEVVVCATDEEGTTRRLADHRFDRGKDNLNDRRIFLFTDLEAELISVKVDAKDWVPTNKFHYRVRLTTEPIKFDRGPVPGFADLHLHQAAELGFGGNQLWGSHIGPQDEALPECGIETVPGELASTFPLPEVKTLHGLVPFSSSLGEGEARHGHGAPGFGDWPHYNDILHQQVHEDWLKDAHDGGLNLVVVSAVNFEGLCYLLKVFYPRPGDRMGCRDMENVERQLEAFIEMDEQRDWYEIAVHPWHARKIIHEGKLAVVLSMEVSHLLPRDEGDFVTQLDRLWGLGLRTLQLAHETDSRFAGAAPHRDLFELFQALKWPGPAATGNAFAHARGDVLNAYNGFRYDENGKNAVGLRPAGIELVEAMIDRHMLIDVSHLSERSMQNLHQLVATRHSYYPLYDSHTRFKTILTDQDKELQQEFLTTEEQIRYIRETGGMVGLRTGQNAIITVIGESEDGVLNDCDGTSKSFAQLVHYGKKAGIPMGLGSDFNGFINQLGPRYGDENCPAAGTTGTRRNQTEAPRAECELPPGVAGTGPGTGPAGRDFDTEGLRHVGYLPDLVSDLEALKTPGVEIIKSSAEAFIRMWERAYDPDRTRIGDDIDLAREVSSTRASDWKPCQLYKESLGVLTELTGNWIRTGGNNPRYNGMRVSFEGGRARLTAMPQTGFTSFATGMILWQNVAGDGTLEVRGSDGDYYEAEIELEGEDRLHIDIDHTGAGYDQTWERAGPTIDGEWVLVAATGRENEGLRVQVEGDRAVIRYLPAAAWRSLRSGDILWREIGRGDGGEVGRIEVRTADRSYEAAEYTLNGEDRLRLVVEAGGSEQNWVRPDVAKELAARDAGRVPFADLRPSDFSPELRPEIAARVGALPTFDAFALHVSDKLPAVVSGLVFHDLDADGTHDEGEPGLAGVTIRVIDEESGQASTLPTDANGLYRFESRSGGRLRLSVDASSLPLEGAPTTQPPEYELEVDRGFTVPAINFGFGEATAPGGEPEAGPGSRARRLRPAETGVAGFVGVVPEGARTSGGDRPAPAGRPIRLQSWDDFAARFADPGDPSSGGSQGDAEAFRALQLAVRGFFENGGRIAWVVRTTGLADLEDLSAELAALRDVNVDLVAVPGATGRLQHEAILAHVEAAGDRIALLDGRPEAAGSDPARVRASPRNSDRATLLFPWLLVRESSSDTVVRQPPSGHVAGLLARVDREEGVHHPPADRLIAGAVGPAIGLSASQIAALNPDGVLVLRADPGGAVTWGARTLGGDANGAFRYLQVRRSVDRVVETMRTNLGSESCEDALEPIEDFLDGLWREGVLQGARKSEAYFVRCRPRSDELRAGVALLRPGEFVPIALTLGG